LTFEPGKFKTIFSPIITSKNKADVWRVSKAEEKERGRGKFRRVQAKFSCQKCRVQKRRELLKRKHEGVRREGSQQKGIL